MEGSITKAAHDKLEAVAEEEAPLTEEEANTALQEAQQRSERALDHIAEIWVEMASTEAFGLLLDELENQAVKHRKRLLDLAFESGLEISQRDVDYDRGLTDGCRRAREIISVARKRLDKRDGKPETETTEEERRYW